MKFQLTINLSIVAALSTYVCNALDPKLDIQYDTSNTAAADGGQIILSVQSATDASCPFSCSIFDKIMIDFSKGEFCPAGKYNGDGSGTCDKKFEAGFYGLFKKGSDNYIGICAAGYICTGNPSGIRPCNAGYYCARDVKPSNSHRDLRITVERECSTGEFSGSAASTCSVCTAGKFAGVTASTSCSNCAAGKFSSAGAASCTACNPGKFSGVGASSCANCADGQTSLSPFATCTNCVAGKFAVSGASTCSNCAAGKFSSTKAKECTLCSPGKFTSTTGKATCDDCTAGYYCPGNGVTIPTECPIGYYCPKGSSTPLDPHPGSANSDRFASTASTTCSGDYCNRYMNARENIIVQAHATSLNDSTLLASQFRTVILQSVSRFQSIVSNASTIELVSGQQYILDCEKNTHQTPIFLHPQSKITLGTSSTANKYTKLMFRNCFVFGGRIVMKKRSMIILDNSSIDIRNIDFTDATTTDPVYIVTKDSSHLSGLSKSIPNSLIVIQDGSPEATVLGCDLDLACNQALFVPNPIIFADPLRKYFNNIDPNVLSPDTTAAIVVDQANATTSVRKLISLQSLFTCGMYGSTTHARSTYLGRALYCAAETSATDSDEFYENINNVLSKLIDSLPTSEVDLIFIRNTKNAANARFQLSQSFGLFDDSSELIAIPAHSVNFLTSKSTSKTIPSLSISLNRVSSNINELTRNMHDRIQDLYALETIVNNVNDARNAQLDVTITLFKNLKADAQISKNVADESLRIANLEERAVKGKMQNILDSVDQNSDQMEPTMTELSKAVGAAIEEAKREALGKAIANTLIMVGQLAVAAATKDPNSAAGALSGAVDVYDDWKTFVDTKKLEADSTNLNQAIEEFNEIREALVNARYSAANFTHGSLTSLSGFTLPVTKVQLIEGKMISALGEAGCNIGLTGDRVISLCDKATFLIHIIFSFLVEGFDSLPKLLELSLRKQLLDFESKQFATSIQNWNDGVQAVTSLKNLESTFPDEITARKNYILNLFHASLTRAQVQSVLMVNNAVSSSRTLCRAVAYEHSNALTEDFDDTQGESEFRASCKKSISNLPLEFVLKELDSLLDTVNQLQFNPTAANLAYSIPIDVDVTQFVNKETVWKNYNMTVQLSPETNPLLFSDTSFRCYNFLALNFAVFYMLDQNKRFLTPGYCPTCPISFIHHTKVTGPFIKKYNQNRYVFNMDSEGGTFNYANVIKADTTSGTLKPSQDGPNSLFALPTPFGIFNINIDPRAKFENATFVLGLFVNSKEGFSIEGCTSNTATGATAGRRLETRKKNPFESCTVHGSNQLQCYISSNCMWDSELQSCFDYSHDRVLALGEEPIAKVKKDKCPKSKNEKKCTKGKNLKLCFWDPIQNLCISKEFSNSPTNSPVTQNPTKSPNTQNPTKLPTNDPSKSPTLLPTLKPTTRSPSKVPTTAPTTQKPTTKSPTPPTFKSPTLSPFTLSPTVPTTLRPTQATPPTEKAVRLRASNGQWLQAGPDGIIHCLGGIDANADNSTFVFLFRHQIDSLNIFYMKADESWADGKFTWMRVLKDGMNHMVVSKRDELAFTMPPYFIAVEINDNSKLAFSTAESKYVSCKTNGTFVADVDRLDSNNNVITPGTTELFDIVIV